jgi:hypothetical protein
MAKKKKSVELSDKKISFDMEKKSYKVIRFFPTQMSLDVMVFKDGIKQGMKNISFAHIPKEAKKLIKAK